MLIEPTTGAVARVIDHTEETWAMLIPCVLEISSASHETYIIMRSHNWGREHQLGAARCGHRRMRRGG
jgi:hypothetical protein